MRALLRPARFALLVFSTVGLLPFALLAAPLRLAGLRRAGLASSALLQGLWARAMLSGIGVEVRIDGTLPPRTERTLVVANHLSYLDIFVLGALFPGRFVAKGDIARWPVIGWLARLAGTIFIVQADKRDLLRVTEQMERTLNAGVRVLVFAEGRSSRGIRVERLHSALFEVAVRKGIPCRAVTLGYDVPNDPWAPAATVCWWGGMRFWSHFLRLLGHRRILARVAVAPRLVIGRERKELTAELQRALEERFVPIRQAPLPPDFPWPEIFRDAVVPTADGPSPGAGRPGGRPG